MVSKTPSLLLSTALLLLFSPACGVLDLFDPEPSDPNDRVAVGTILRLPEILLPDESVGLPAMTDARVFFGQRGAGADLLLSNPEPLTNATVTLTMIGDEVVDVPLPHVEQGFYGASSEEETALEYQPGATYRVTIGEQNRIYEMDIDRVPESEMPSGVPDLHPREQPMTITWSQRRSVLVEVYRLTTSGVRETHSNRPSDVREIVLLALEKEPSEPEYVIPADAFLNNGPHVLVFILLERGFPDSGLFAGSALLAGAGQAVMFEVGP